MSGLERHGGPYDRGAADAWYGRPKIPHYYRGASYHSERVEGPDMCVKQVEEYNAGYDGMGGRKDYGRFDETHDPEVDL